VAQIDGLSWRRFGALLRGLGPNSACVTRAAARKYGEVSDQRVTVVDGGPEAATAVFRALFGGEAGKG